MSAMRDDVQSRMVAAIPARQITRARTWTGDVEWYTPANILEAAAEVLGAIDLDPASAPPLHVTRCASPRDEFAFSKSSVGL
jgi:hypothetical protein